MGGYCHGPGLGEEGDSGDRSKLIPDTFLRQNEEDLVVSWMWGTGQERNEDDFPISDLSNWEEDGVSLLRCGRLRVKQIWGEKSEFETCVFILLWTVNSNP